MTSLPLYFLLSLKASLFSTGGMGSLPSLHSDMIARGWAGDRQFAESLAVGQVSPGPSGLWTICLGYLVAGLPGAIVALIAITLPPFLVLAIDRLYQRVQHHPAVEGFVRGLGLAVVGIFVIVLLTLLVSTGLEIRSAAIAPASLGLAATRRVPVAAIIALAAGVGIAWR